MAIIKIKLKDLYLIKNLKQIHNQDKRLDFKILETGIIKFIFNNLKESDSILVNSK